MLNFLSWVFGYSYSPWSAALNGRIDGAKGIPDGSQTMQPPYIMQLKNSAEQDVDQLAQKWSRRDATLLAQYCQAKQKVEAFTHALEKAERDFQNARADEQHARDEHIKYFDLPPIGYWTAVFIVSVAEFFFNSTVFQIFGDDQWKNIIVSLGIGALFPLCAHILGGMLAHGVLKEGRFSTRTVKIILLIVLPFAALLGIAWVREKFLEAMGVQKTLGVEMSVEMLTAVFLIFNLAIYFGMTVAAYVSHDPTVVKYRTDLRIAMKLRKNAEHRIKINEHGRERALHHQHAVESLRLKEFEGVKHAAKESRDAFQRMMATYHAHNIRERENGVAMPECFKKYPPIDVSKEIEPGTDSLHAAQLSWDCAKVLRDFNVDKTIAMTKENRALDTNELKDEAFPLSAPNEPPATQISSTTENPSVSISTAEKG